MLQLSFAQETLSVLETPQILICCISRAFLGDVRWLYLLRKALFLGRNGGTVSGVGTAMQPAVVGKLRTWLRGGDRVLFGETLSQHPI